MAIYQRPGVYVEETLNPTAPVVGLSSTSVAAFVGASDRGPAAPTLISSWSQYVKYYGGWNISASNDLPHAVFSFFSNGGSSAYIYRVVGSGSDVAKVEILDDSDDTALVISAKDAGLWGTNIYVKVANVGQDTNGDVIYDLIVYYGGITPAYSVERFSAVSSAPNNPRFVEAAVSNSNYITVDAQTITAPLETTPDPVALLAGANGAAVTQENIAGSLSALDVITSSLILNACGVTTATYVNQVLSYADDRQDVFVVIDPTGATASDQVTAAEAYSSTSFGACYYPKLVVADPTSRVPGATTTISPSGAVVGLFTTTDASRGVFKAPAGLSARLSGVVSVPSLTNAELDSMNSAPSAVNAIRYIPGSGVVVMGARTLNNTYADKYIPVRRSLIYLRKALTDLTQFAIFEPNDSRLWRRLEEEVTRELLRFWREGGLRGTSASDAFFVKCDEDNNTLASIDAGEVNIEVGVALQRPAEFVIIKIGQFEGGTVVTVA